MRARPIHYFGRGTAHIIMPRAATRDARSEWPITPSLLILLISLTLFTVYKLTIEDKVVLKKSRTIIVIPQVPPLPKPTVKEKISFFKVVKDAAKKSSEPRKRELKKVLEPKKIEKPKTPPPPKPVVPHLKPKVLPKPVAKPLQVKKRLKPLSQAPPKELKAMQAQKPKPLKPLAKLDKKPVTLAPKPESLRPKASAKLKKPVQPPKVRPKTVAPVKKPVAGPVSQVKQTTAKLTPKPLKKTAPTLAATAPSAIAPKATAKETPLQAKAAPRKAFTPLAANLSKGPVKAKKSAASAPVMAAAPRRSGPAPELTQLTGPPSASLPAAHQEMPSGQNVEAGASHRAAPNLDIAPQSDYTLASSGDDGGGPALHTLVTIEGSTLGSSLRVKSLKEEIYRKTRFMSPEKSPYIYRVRGYTCTVVIASGNGSMPMATLTFEPRDATFEVVSALERLLPRR